MTVAKVACLENLLSYFFLVHDSVDGATRKCLKWLHLLIWSSLHAINFFDFLLINFFNLQVRRDITQRPLPDMSMFDSVNLCFNVFSVSLAGKKLIEIRCSLGSITNMVNSLHVRHINQQHYAIHL